VHLTGVHLTGMHLTGVHLVGISQACISQACISFWEAYADLVSPARPTRPARPARRPHCRQHAANPLQGSFPGIEEGKRAGSSCSTKRYSRMYSPCLEEGPVLGPISGGLFWGQDFPGVSISLASAFSLRSPDCRARLGYGVIFRLEPELAAPADT
jgi:hypothetical protein